MATDECNCSQEDVDSGPPYHLTEELVREHYEPLGFKIVETKTELYNKKDDGKPFYDINFVLKRSDSDGV